MPAFTVEVSDHDIVAHFDAIGPNAQQALRKALTPLAGEIASDARGLAEAHIHSLGKKAPGSYLTSIYGGVSEQDGSVLGFVRSSHPLAHLLELGFTISDWEIVPGTGRGTTSYIGAIMAFGGDAATVFRQHVHRHQMQVRPYPAITPAFEARSGEVLDAIEGAVKGAVRSK